MKKISLTVVTTFLLFGCNSTPLQNKNNLSNDHNKENPINQKCESFYKKDEKLVYDKNGIVIKNADPKTFKCFNHIYSRDKNNFFMRFKIIDNIKDIESIKILDHSFIADKYNIYFCTFYDGCNIFKNADPKTFDITLREKGFLQDKDFIYREVIDFGHGSLNKWQKLNNVDRNSFILLKNGYFKDKNHVYFNYGIFYVLLNNIDSSSISVIDQYTIKDKNHVYFLKEKPFPSTLYPNDVPEKEYEKIYKKFIEPVFDDNNYIPPPQEHEMVIVKNTDTNSFLSLSSLNDYYKDKNHIYCTTKEKLPKIIVLKDADINSFQVLDRRKAKDKKHLYSGCKIVKNLK